jgi:two-component system sensor histidine kinase CiaH
MGWGINLKNNSFLKARLKLTLFYAASLFVVIVIFSSLLYALFVNNIINSNEFEGENYSELNANKEFQVLNDAISRLRLTLIITDAGIIIIVTVLGYFLSNRTLKPIKNSLEEQKRFVSDSAHELRTPLTIMKTGIETVTTGKKQSLKEYQALTKDLLEEINKLINMSNGLLFLSKKDSVGFLISHESLNISLICEKQINLFQPYAAKKSVFLNSNIKGQYYLKGNYEQISQLVTNLLKNAIDYNKHGGNVSLFLEKQKNNIILKVTDTGIGIAPDDLKHIYKRFYKADESRSISDSGAGLGLSIVKEIVNLNRGIMKINSILDKGTEVIISFPTL